MKNFLIAVVVVAIIVFGCFYFTKKTEAPVEVMVNGATDTVVAQ